MNNSNLEIKSLGAIYSLQNSYSLKKILCIVLIIVIVFLFFPWTQNIRSNGKITTLEQQYRPQKINSPIPGKISKWYVKEGDFVKKGDTILVLTEIKDDYLDPDLILQTKNQLDAKKMGIVYYQKKVLSMQRQIKNLNQSKLYKIEQLKNKFIQLNNKLKAENAELEANENELSLLKNQYERQLKMYDEGLVSQTQLQQRNIQYQNSIAKKIISENKIAQTLQEININKIEISGTEQEYLEKINKTDGDNFQSLNQITTSQGEIAKLQNQLNNYTIRNGMYILTAPQDGQIVQANKSGIGEILKEGEAISTIVPNKMDYAVELFIQPFNLPLIQKNQRVRFVFDGYPAIVFSGWPAGSYGTFSGRVSAIENTISENGMYRLLVSEESIEKKWPSKLRIGAGANGIILLNDVSIWYELWRNINGFPVDFYEPKNTPKDEKK